MKHCFILQGLFHDTAKTISEQSQFDNLRVIVVILALSQLEIFKIVADEK